MWSKIVFISFFLAIQVKAQADEALEHLCNETLAAYCDCKNVKTFGVNRVVIKCDFNAEKDVLLSDKVFGTSAAGYSSAYVRITNAKSVTVTEAFMKEWQQAVSSALDIWYCGRVVLSSSPPVTRPKSMKSFVGIGLIDCTIPEIPEMLMRDHHRGALRLKNCTVGSVEAGAIENIDELRYLVFEGGSVGSFKGPISKTKTVTLSSKTLHSWNGVLLDNLTINSIKEGSFNMVHYSDTEDVVVKGCKVRAVGAGAFTLKGDIATTFTGNDIDNVQAKAFQMRTTGALVFINNRLSGWSPDAFIDMTCSVAHDISNNTLVVTTPDYPDLGFDSTCGTPQMVIEVVEGWVSPERVSPEQQKHQERGTDTIAVTLSLLTLAVIGAAAGVVIGWWRKKGTYDWMIRYPADTPLCEDQDDMQSISVCRFEQPEPSVQLS